MTEANPDSACLDRLSSKQAQVASTHPCYPSDPWKLFRLIFAEFFGSADHFGADRT